MLMLMHPPTAPQADQAKVLGVNSGKVKGATNCNQINWQKKPKSLRYHRTKNKIKILT